MNGKKLGIIWSSADPEVATHMLFMHAHNSMKKNWWQEVRLIVWGPSAALLVKNTELQEKLKEMAADGVDVWTKPVPTSMLSVLTWKNWGLTLFLWVKRLHKCFSRIGK